MAFRSCKPFSSIPRTNNNASYVFLLMLASVLLITLSPPPVGCIPTGTKPGIICKEIERQALLTLKAGLVDKAGRLSSWSDDNPNCCNWKGVSCSNHTGHVFKLNLRNPFPEQAVANNLRNSFPEQAVANPEDDKYIENRLEGEISSCLLELKYLEYLDLSQNFFNYTEVPPSLGSLEELRYLNLSSSHFLGIVPPSLGNLSRLEYLDLGRNYYDDGLLEVGSWQWLTGMSSLTYLNLDSVDLSKAQESDWWGEVFNKLPNLLELHLSACGLSNLPMSINHHPMNFTSSLSFLDLSYNHGLEVGSWQWLTGMSSLMYLNLASVDLSKAQESGWLGDVFNKFPNLLELHLSYCGLSNLPMAINHHPMNFTSSVSILDLSSNDFSSSLGMPLWLFNLTGLVDLGLSHCSMSFNIPHEIGRLVALQQLDLSENDGIGGQLPASLGNLTNLVTLNLENSVIEGRIPVTLGNLCKLRELNLQENRLEGDINEFIYGLATCSSDHPHLETLDLSSNKLLGTLPSSLGNLTNLENLFLASNKLLGTLPISLGSLSNLVYLDLSNNSFWGSIPTTIESLTALRYLDLSSNKMNGTIAETIGKLQELEKLDLSGNQWRGQMLNEAHFEKHTKLQSLQFSSTSKEEVGNLLLVLNVTQDWLPPFRRSLVDLRLYGVKMSSKMFPRWTQTLRELESLSLRDCGIADSIPTEFWKSFPHINYLDLSNNAISIPTTFNNMGRHVHAAGKLKTLDLANNCFGNNGGGSGIGIPSNIHQLAPSLENLDLSSNSLSGEIPRSISRLQSLSDLSLRNNLLNGELTHLHWENMTSLFIIDLSNNSLVGKIPQSLVNLVDLGVLLLNDNSLQGEIPSFTNLSYLRILDLGGNKLSGSVPPTLANHNPDLLVFRLRGNMLSGTIPLELCLLSKLQTLDLAHNNFTGTIPWCLGNLSTTDADANQYFPNGITLVVKGREYKYDRNILSLVHLVDLSHNNLSGTIPKSLMNLTAMQTLNLSMNHLTGEIPSNIGLLQELETLDLSQNHLSGEIPSSISDISSLNYLNLSHNDLSGRIPLSRQLQTLDTNSCSYDGNPLLCGLPLPTTCPGDGTPNGYQGEGEENVGHAKRKFDIEDWGFVLSIVLGFVVGFWGVCGSLVLKPSWRQAYFGYLVGVKEKIIVVVVLNVTRFRRKMGISE